MLDIRLVGTLAVRDGLMEETVSLAELPELQEREIVSKELYKEIRDQVQSAVRRQFTMEETDSTLHLVTARNKTIIFLDFKFKNIFLIFYYIII